MKVFTQPPKLVVAKPRELDRLIAEKEMKKLPFMKAHAFAKDNSLRIAGFKEVNSALEDGNGNGNPLFWAGQIAAMRKPITAAIGEQIEFDYEGTKWMMLVPKIFQKESAPLLLVDHPDYEIEVDSKKKRRVVHVIGSRVNAVQWFPRASGKYSTDEVTGFPKGGISQGIPGTISLWLNGTEEGYVGPVIVGRDLVILSNQPALRAPTTRHYVLFEDEKEKAVKGAKKDAAKK